MIAIQFPGGHWDYRTPHVFRYIHQAHIDLFFEHATLRLSSFAQFAKHQDNERFDPTEGAGVLTGFLDNGTILAAVKGGQDGWVLSTTTREDPELMGTFGVDGYFAITNTTAFAAEIAKKLDGFQGGIEGHCIYTNHPGVRRVLSGARLDDLLREPGGRTLDLNRVRAALGDISMPDLFLLKSHCFRHQAEYRIIWRMPTAVPHASIDVICPEALKYCERRT